MELSQQEEDALAVATMEVVESAERIYNEVQRAAGQQSNRLAHRPARADCVRGKENSVQLLLWQNLAPSGAAGPD